jgi:lambda family phage portal protein
MRKSVLRGASVGGGVSYHKLAGDLEAVNFSSARAGELSDRDLWREYQEFIISNVCEPIYKKWLEMAWLSGALSDVKLQDYERIQEPTFRGRGWSWVDPAKDMKAHVEGLAAGITTLTDIKAEQGIDIEDHFINLKKERELAAKYGIEPTWTQKKDAQPIEPVEPDEEK